MKKFAFIGVILSFLVACDKPEGEGGNCTIKGMAWIEDWNGSYTQLLAEYPAADAEVYIIYGNETAVGDRIRANFNGAFEFKYLRKGKYKVYVYSKDKTLQSPSGQVAVVKEIEIKNDGDTFNTDTLVIYE